MYIKQNVYTIRSKLYIVCCTSLCKWKKDTADASKGVTLTEQSDSAVQADSVSSATSATPDSDVIEVWPSSLDQDETEKQKISYRREPPTGDPAHFHEVWGYLLEGRESDLTSTMPITDLCIFCAEINIYGELSGVPSLKNVKDFKGRKHLVIACDSRVLTHFVLDPEYSVRERVIMQIVQAGKLYDGVQIDFEQVPARDIKNFRNFLNELREKLGSEKWFSIALPARIKTLSDDAYDYTLIAPCVDRIIVMAYDQHWSGSVPGPVAGYDWCERIADYATKVIPQKKLVMGLPFYGRTWANESPASAFRFAGINEVMNDNKIHEVSRDEGLVPCFTYTTTITVSGYFDDAVSLLNKARLYESKSVNRVAFWRIGQEDLSFWKWIQLN